MIGTPISHVRTPHILNQLFGRDRHDLRVVRKRLGQTGLGRHVAALRQDSRMLGLVVTTPLKAAICDHLERRTPLVELVRSANCVRFDADGWIGANFDGFGFMAGLAEAGIDLAGRRVRLAGCGGAGKPIVERIVAARAAVLAVEDVDTASATDFVHRLRSAADGCEVTFGAAEGRDSQVLVNATPLGMRRRDPSPFPPEIVARSEVVVDIVVAAFPSALQRAARRLGKTFVAGDAMVEGQAELLRRFLLTDAVSEPAVVRMAARSAQRRGAA